MFIYFYSVVTLSRFMRIQLVGKILDKKGTEGVLIHLGSTNSRVMGSHGGARSKSQAQSIACKVLAKALA